MSRYELLSINGGVITVIDTAESREELNRKYMRHENVRMRINGRILKIHEAEGWHTIGGHVYAADVRFMGYKRRRKHETAITT